MSIDIMVMLLSTVGGFISQMYANNAEARTQEMQLALGSVQEAKKSSTLDKWIRASISMTLLLLLSFVMVGPAFLDTHVTLVEQGWLWTSTTEIKGIIYDDNFRTMLTAMTFFYLGRSPAIK